MLLMAGELRTKGASINDVHKNFGLSNPSSLVRIRNRFKLYNSHNLPYNICFSLTPSDADVIFGGPKQANAMHVGGGGGGGSRRNYSGSRWRKSWDAHSRN